MKNEIIQLNKLLYIDAVTDNFSVKRDSVKAPLRKNHTLIILIFFTRYFTITKH